MKTILGCIFLLLISSLAYAQDTGSITGTVTDASAAAVAGAQVTVTNTASGVARQTVTNSSGEYLVAGLRAGTYDLAITSTGFKKFQSKGIILRVAQKARADASLSPGAVTTEVTVSGEGVAAVDTQSSETAGTVTGKEITQLQLNGRNFTQLINLMPGVTNQTGQDEGTVGVYGSVAFSINGGRTEYNNWELDGGDNMDNGSNTTLNVYPSVEAIGEVRMLTSSYGAQYGRSGSGTVEAVTRSGTNAFHGSVYEFLRNDFFNARNFFDDPTRGAPAYKKHDYGYTFGGPVFIPGHYNANKQKTFFFWSEEWRRQTEPTSFDLPVPTDAERAGNFSDLCPNPASGSFQDCPINPATGAAFPGNTVTVDPNAQALLALIPNANSGGNFFNGASSVPTRWREELIKVDHNFSSKLQASFRYIHDSWNTVTPTTLWTDSSFPTVQTNFVGPGVSMVARLNAIASPTLVNEFVFSYTTDHIALSNVGPVQRPASMTMTGLFNNGFGGKLPGVSLHGNDAYGGGFASDAGFIPWTNSNPTYTFRDNVSKSLGNHNLQFGAYYVAAQKNEENSPHVQGLLTFNSDSGVSTGNSFADLLTGRIDSFQQTNSQIKYYNRYKILEPYLQDDWHVSKRLTLNLGLRMSLFGTYRERYQQAYNFDPAAYDPTKAPIVSPVDGSLSFPAGQSINTLTGMVKCGAAGAPPGCQKGHLFNPAPRIGFAFDPFGDGKTSIRGAYGVFFEHTNGNESNAESLEGSAPGVLTSTQNNVVGYTNIGGGQFFPLAITTGNGASIPNQVVWPYMQQWHLDVQRDIGRNTVFTVAYVGSKGTHLTTIADINQLKPVPLSQNPYKPGEPITFAADPTDLTQHDDCRDLTTVSGVPITGQAAVNLSVACGANADLLRTAFPGFNAVMRIDSLGSSSYHALQSSLRRTIGGLIVNASYTYSHAIDGSSSRGETGSVFDSYNLSASRASSTFDQRHLFNISYVYDLPFFRAAGLAHNVLGGWQFSGITLFQTGTPFSVINSTGALDNAGVANGVTAGSYPDLVGDPFAAPANPNVPGVPGPLLYNPNAFAAPRGLTFGDTGRNRLRNPSRTNFDMAVFKHFQFGEKAGLEFRTEVFNIFNHTQWQTIDPNFTGTATGTFLHPNAAHRPRTMQFGLKLSF